MKIQIKSSSEADKVVLQGEVDFQTAADLRQELQKLTARRSPKILIDLKKVSYIDSSGLAAFVGVFQSTKSYGGKIAFFNLSEGVRDIFRISKLDSVFPLATNEKEALSLLV